MDTSSNKKSKTVFLQDIIGMEDVKNQIKSAFILPLYQPQLFSKRTQVKSALFYGPPGTGKTKIVEALAKDIDAKLYSLNNGDFLRKYVGESEQKLSNIFEEIRAQENTCILFIDEVDGVCRQRSGRDTDHSRSIKSELLKHLSSISEAEHAILIAATNRPWDIDSAFMRRFQAHIYFGLPSLADRNSFLNYVLEQQNIALDDDDDWQTLLDLTGGYSIADLENVVRNAARRPLREVQNWMIWIMDNGSYVPYDCSTEELVENILNVTFCSIYELPVGSVKVRSVNTEDLLEAVSEVHRTVSENEIKSFHEFDFQ